MEFLFQVLGVLVAVVVATALLRTRSQVDGAAGVLMMAAAFAAVLGVYGLRSAWVDLDGRRKADALPREEAARTGGPNAPFLAWAESQMASRATFALVPDIEHADPLGYQWSTYQLLPHRLVAPSEARYLVFYAIDPKTADYDHRAFKRPVMQSPTFGLSERRDAR